MEVANVAGPVPVMAAKGTEEWGWESPTLNPYTENLTEQPSND